MLGATAVYGHVACVAFSHIAQNVTCDWLASQWSKYVNK